MGWIAARFGQAILALLAMTIILFVAINLIGDPAEILLSSDATEADRLRLIEGYGLNLPLWQQYLSFLRSALFGDFGRSFVFNMPASSLILSRFPATLELALVALLLACFVGIPLGLYAGLRPETPLSRLIMGFSIIGFSVPTFWLGLLMIMVFAVGLGWLPSTGRGETVQVLGMQWSFFTTDGLRHLILPAMNLALFKISLVLRLTRAGVREVALQDYIKFARAKGLRPSRIVGTHILKNVMIPVVTVLGMEFGSLIAFSVVTETIYAWPGTGKLLIDSINTADRPVIVAYLALIVVLFIAINLVVDILCRLLDPRLSAES